MPFLILSRQGLADLQAAGPVRDALWLNPGLFSDAEIAQLVIAMKGELEKFREQLENLE